MSGLNKGRVVNVRFNKGMLYYEDIILNSYNEDILIDMVNGSGKSFLIQCLGQTVIPNSTWQNDWEFKNVFDPNNKNTVIHTQTEWVLDDGMDYKYMIAGFCASKPNKSMGDGERLYSDFDRFSYICLYNSPNENDIANMPLKTTDANGSNKFMSLSELKKHLGKIKSNDYYTEVFTSSTAYKNRLAQYNITSAEWDIIRGVNADEKYVATYLRAYSTAEKLIRDFLIPKIEECNSNRADFDYQNGDALAKSLMDIRGHLSTLMETKAQSKEYEKMIGFIENISEKLVSIGDCYDKRDLIYIEIKKTLRVLNNSVNELNEELRSTQTEQQVADTNFKQASLDCDVVSTKILETDASHKKELLNTQTNKVSDIETLVSDERSKLTVAKLENVYHDILMDKLAMETNRERLNIIELSNRELTNERISLATSIKGYLVKSYNANKDEIVLANSGLQELDDAINCSQSGMNKLASEIMSLESDNRKLNTAKELNITKMNMSKFRDIDGATVDATTKSSLEEVLESKKVEIDETKVKIEDLDSQIKEAAVLINEGNIHRSSLSNELSNKSALLTDAQNSKEFIDVIIGKYGESHIDDLLIKINESLDSNREQERILINNISEIKNVIRGLSNHSITLTKDTMEIYKRIASRYNSAVLGMEFIANLSMKDKVYFVNLNELIPYAILVDSRDYNKVINDTVLFESYFGGAIPIIDKDNLQTTALYPNNVFFTSKDSGFYENEANIEALRISKEAELVTLKESLNTVKTEVSCNEKYRDSVKLFINKFKDYAHVDMIAAEVRSLDLRIEETHKEIMEYRTLETSLKADRVDIKNQLLKLEAESNLIASKIVLVAEYIELTEANSRIISETTSNLKELGVKKEYVEREDVIIRELRSDKQTLDRRIRDLIIKGDGLERDIQQLEYVSVKDCSDVLTTEEFIDFKAKLAAVNDNLAGASNDLFQIETSIVACSGRIRANEERIAQEEYTLDYFGYVDISFVRNSLEKVQEIDRNLKRIVKELGGENSKKNSLNQDYIKADTAFNIAKENILKTHGVEYEGAWASLEVVANRDDSTLESMQQSTTKAKSNLKKYIQELRVRVASIETDITKTNQTINDFRLVERDITVEVDIDDVEINSMRGAKEIEKSLKSILNTITHKKSSYSRELVKASEGVEYIHGFKDTLYDLKSLPESKTELASRVKLLIGESNEGFESFITLAKKELVRTEEEISYLIQKEEDFVTLCIQKSENILRDLKKLTELSAIDVSGRKQEMMRVNLTKLPDDDAREKMRNYIEGLISNFSEDTIDSEKRDIIAKGLRIDKLFVQIIAPIKNNAIELYKLEDIENPHVNQWLPWDRGVGSKGQTNGMYISVLICLISYLRKLYNTSTDNSRKVLILDNPFSGTTSEIIWYPILKLLKANNVQLWAFGFEVKSQLADCFSRRYYPIKAPTKNYEKIIIPDFESLHDLSSLSYDPLTGKAMDASQIGFDL